MALANTSSLSLLPNISNLMSCKLTESNYALWKYQISAILRTQNLFHFLDGSLPSPPPYLLNPQERPTENPNPSYTEWKQQDQVVFMLLNSTVTEESLTHVGRDSARDAWQTLERRYGSLMRSNIFQLKSELQSVSKQSDPIDIYIQRIKKVRDRLAVSGVFLDDEDVLLYILNGLPPEYNAFRSSMQTRSELVTLEHLHVMLRADEHMLDRQHTFVDPAQAMAVVYHNMYPPRGRTSPRGYRGQGGHYRGPSQGGSYGRGYSRGGYGPAVEG